MSSRAAILASVKANQPEATTLPPADLVLSDTWGESYRNSGNSNIELFRTVLTTIGGALIEVADHEAIKSYIKEHYPGDQRIISTLPELNEVTEQGWESADPHDLENVDLAILQAHFGVAENAALWLTEDLMQQRAVPFICQQLAVVVSKNGILTTMHEAYARIGEAEYGFGAFIAGPSKTADIEQSLVLGAHGPKGMTVFLLA
jgi:L-lactate dehydrogenase complex protein LldG